MIPILLDKTKTLSELVSSITGGLGDITGAFDGVAVEEANGLKEITFKLPIDSPRYSDLSVGSYVKVKVDELHNPQIYEVYKITKPLKGIVTVKAEHISYKLGKATVLPFTATGITPTTIGMINNLAGTYPFTFSSDIVNATSTFTLKEPMSFRGAIGGWDGSVLDTFGGELDWDNLDVHLYAHRGRDRGVRIEYGKNLVDLTQEESNANVYDAVIGYATVNEVTYVGDIQKITTTNSPRTLNVDFSSAFGYDETPTTARLNQLALAYAQRNNIGIPKINLKVSFEPLAKFSEYEDIALLEQTGLFDTLTVLFPKLGVNATAKVIRTEYDFINEKPISIELGNAKTNLISLIDTQVEENLSGIDIEGAMNHAVGQLDEYIEGFTGTIANSLGLFLTKVEKSGGGYQIYLHNQPNLTDSQYQWTINAGGFAVSQDYGQTWTAGIDINGNAVFNSLAANVVNAMQIYGSYIQGSQIAFGNPTELNAKYIIAQSYTNTSNEIVGISFDGSGYVRFQPQEEFSILNTDGSSHNLNNFVMTGSSNSSNPVVTIDNYSATSGNIGNQFKMSATSTASTITLLNQKSGAKKNRIYMHAGSSDSGVTIENVSYNTTNVANSVVMNSSSSGNSTTIANNNTSGTTINSITLNSDGTTRIYSTSTITIQGDGRIDMYSAGSQDLRLISADDIHLRPVGYIEVNSYYIYFDSDGYVRATTSRPSSKGY